jgi:hypothetical protein
LVRPVDTDHELCSGAGDDHSGGQHHLKGMPRQIDLFPQNLQVANNPNNQISVTSAQIANLNAQIPAALAAAETAFINSVLTAIDQATGLDLAAWATELEGLFTGSTNVLTAFTTAATNAWNNWVATLNNLEQESVASFTSWLQTLLEPNSPLNASNLWGLIPTKSVGAVAATAVNSTTPNLLTNPDFQAAISLSPGGQWTWDSTVYYTPPSGDTAPGAAKVVANGTAQGLRSNPISVSGGQVLALSANILTSGLTYTGTPIELDVITFLGNTQVAVTPVVTSAAPTGATTSWVNPPSGSVAGTLTGNFPVPSSGVDGVKVRLALDSTATAGSVWFGAVSATLSGGLIASIQNDLSTLQSDSNASNAAFSTFLQSVLSDITGYTSWSTFITAVESAWNTYTTTVSGLASNEIFTIQQLINSLLGINTSTGQMSAANVSSSSSGGSSLANDWTTFWDWLTGTTSNPAATTGTQVQASAVTGAGGQANIVTALETTWDQLVQAFTGGTTTGNSLGQLANAAQSTSSTASNAQMTAQAATMVQAQQATAKPGYMAIDATMDAVFPLSHMIAAPTYNNVTQTASTMGFIRIPDNISKLSVAWLGSYTGTLSGLYINVYSMNTSTGVLTNVIAGSNYISSVGNTYQWIYYNLPSALVAAPGDVYAVEMVVTGSGTYSLMGLANSTFPANTAVYPQALGALRTGTPTHDAAGAGSFPSGGGSAASYSWSHTVGSSANAILIEFITNGTVSSVKVGTAGAPLLGSKTVAGSVVAYVYQLLNPPTGAQTITVTLTAASSFGGNSDSYNGVSSFGTVATNSGSAGVASVSVSSATGQTAVAAIFNDSASALTGFNQTSRWNNGDSFGYGVFGDAPGASTVSFSASAPAAWAAIGVSLVGSVSPTPPATISSPIYSTTVPWFGLGTSAVSAVPVYAPQTTEYSTHGTYTYTLPTWFRSGVDYLDVIALGAGGGGGGGTTGAGSAGTNTTATVGTTTLTAAGGLGGAGNTVSNTVQSYGLSPHNESYLGTTYYGGTEVLNQAYGSAPGGGGGGGQYLGFYGYGGVGGSWAAATYQPTGTTVSVTVGQGGAANQYAGANAYGACPGADGAVWLVARQA